ncbi:retrovirus-related pol polyprotein from transposon TNT 1-94 [Tanacetum coccineum]
MAIQMRIYSIHPTTQILGDPKSAVQTRSKVNKSSGAYAFISYIQKQRRNNHKDFQHCLFACFLSQIEPKKISEALKDESWVDAMQEELLQFKIQKVWILVDLPYGKKAIGTKWVYINKKDERGVVVRNKARLVDRDYRQEIGIDYIIRSFAPWTYEINLICFEADWMPVQIIITGLKHCESINVQDLESNLYWEFGKFTSRDGESLESYYSRFYKMMNELVRNQCHVNKSSSECPVPFLKLTPEWKRFVTLVKQSQELKTVSYHKLYDILKQHQNEVNEIRAERLARTANPLALVAQQQPVYHPTQNTQYSSTRSQQSTRNRGKAIVTSSAPTYDPEPATVTEDEEMSKEKEIDKLMALISLSFKKIYKPTNNNLRTSSNTSRANQDNSPRINRGTGYDNQRAVNVAGARENVAYHKEKMLLCKQEEVGVQLNAEQADWKDDTDDESDDQELEAHYMYMAQIQEVTPDPVDNSGPIFDDEPMHKVQNNNDNYNVFAMENEHPEQPESSNDIYLAEHGDTNITIDSLDICNDRAQDDQDDTDDLDQERDLLASLIQKLKCEIDDSKNQNKFLESSNKALVDKLKGEIEDFKTKNKSLESSNNHFKEANNELSKTNQLMFKDLKKFQVELDKYNDVNYASKVEIDCAKAKGDLMSNKIDFEKSSNAYT